MYSIDYMLNCVLEKNFNNEQKKKQTGGFCCKFIFNDILIDEKKKKQGATQSMKSNATLKIYILSYNTHTSYKAVY